MENVRDWRCFWFVYQIMSLTNGPTGQKTINAIQVLCFLCRVLSIKAKVNAYSTSVLQKCWHYYTQLSHQVMLHTLYFWIYAEDIIRNEMLSKSDCSDEVMKTSGGGSVAEVGGATSGNRTRCLDEALAHSHVHTLPERTVYWGGNKNRLQKDFRVGGEFVFLKRTFCLEQARTKF